MRLLSTIADFAAIAIEKSYYLAEAKRLSEIDPLTGILNRRGLGRVIDRETTRLRRYQGNLSVVTGDIDGFKGINDSFGHQAGDEVLKSVSATLGGDDPPGRFPWPVTAATNSWWSCPRPGPEEAEIARARLQSALDKVGKAFRVPYSVTLGTHSSSQADFGELFRESDRDLYRRKEGPLTLGENLLAALDDESPAQ